MAKDEPGAATAASIPAYDRVIATRPEIERKGAKIPYTSLNGNMSSYLAEDGALVLRLAASDRAASLRNTTAASTRRTGRSRRSTSTCRPTCSRRRTTSRHGSPRA